MASTDFLPGNAYIEYVLGNGNGSTSLLVFDLLVSQSHTLDSDVTQYPVEQGVQPSDHFQPKAEPVQLEVMLADFVLGEVATSVGRAKSKLATLINIRDTGTLVNLRTRNRKLDNCALIHLAFSFDNQNTQGVPETGEPAISIKVTLGLQQVVVVQTRTAKLIRQKVSDPSVKAMGNEGNKATTPTEPPADSWAWGLFGPDGALVPTPPPGAF